MKVLLSLCLLGTTACSASSLSHLPETETNTTSIPSSHISTSTISPETNTVSTILSTLPTGHSTDLPEKTTIPENVHPKIILNVSKGDVFEITVPGNPTTGYQWEITQIDPAFLELVGKPEFTPQNDQVGSGGDFLLRFKGKQPGKTILVLTYRRPWEKDVPAAHLREYAVFVGN